MEKVLSKKKLGAEIVVNVNEVSRIARGAVLVGDLSAVNDIRVDGHVDGTLYSMGRIVVGESAQLKGAMLCNDTDFWGSLDGDMYVRDVLSLKGSAKIIGNLHVRKLEVEMGAQINGTCAMITEEEYDADCTKVVKAKLPAVSEE